LSYFETSILSASSVTQNKFDITFTISYQGTKFQMLLLVWLVTGKTRKMRQISKITTTRSGQVKFVLLRVYVFFLSGSYLCVRE